MLLAVLSGFILALVLPVISAWFPKRWLFAVAVLPLVLFIYLLTYLPLVANGNHYAINYDWVPSLQINFNFYIDGLSLLFALMITGIGTLVYLYAADYMKNFKGVFSFFSYLSMFMASMLGMVLSDNIFTLFIFWELTSISSFLLIAFKNESKDARKAALMALAVTGLGGLFLLGSFALLTNITGTYRVSEMQAFSPLVKDHVHYIWIVIFFMLAAFTKSAQFPFHFWLPAAMKAPTPVSTYLHSATMVKAGIYIIARFTPVLGDDEFWSQILLTAGSITMLYASLHSIFKKDLKAILAYTTIAVLGLLVFLLGLGSFYALLAMTVFMIAHALYKAAFFLLAGIIDQATGTRDITQLGGLRKIMFPVAVTSFAVVLANSGLPPTFAFIGKELVYEAVMNHTASLSYLLLIIAILTNIFLFYSGFLVGVKPYIGAKQMEAKRIEQPALMLWLPAALLAAAGIIAALVPGPIYSHLVQPAVNAIGTASPMYELKLWHGFNLILGISLLTVIIGLLLYKLMSPMKYYDTWLKSVSGIAPENIAINTGSLLKSFAIFWTKVWQSSYLRSYIFIIISFMSGLIIYKIIEDAHYFIAIGKITPLTTVELIVMLVLIIAIIFTIYTPSRLAAIASLGIVGYSICLLYSFYSAPDLAMTQFAIDTLTVILFLLVLYRLPKYISYSNRWKRIRDKILAGIFGLVITVIALQVIYEPTFKPVSEFYAEQAYTAAKGKNVVNVILVDFRGADTLMEIIVLVIASLGVFALLKLQLDKYDREFD